MRLYRYGILPLVMALLALTMLTGCKKGNIEGRWVSSIVGQITERDFNPDGTFTGVVDLGNPNGGSLPVEVQGRWTMTGDQLTETWNSVKVKGDVPDDVRKELNKEFLNLVGVRRTYQVVWDNRSNMRLVSGGESGTNTFRRLR